MRICPYCGTGVADNPWAEVAHMNSVHPSIIAARLRAVGMLPADDDPIFRMGARDGVRYRIDVERRESDWLVSLSSSPSRGDAWTLGMTREGTDLIESLEQVSRSVLLLEGAMTE